eukprot:GFUD01008979.1.p1 GENE.GFUD01008979.1~~GFUD01008979.1.p1  ORF type:complete len:407 (-),score=89.99 GFUD01008979.1:1043-2263(-)
MLMATTEVMPESPLDVLSRAATMVESGHTSPASSDSEVSPRMQTSPPTGLAVRSNIFKEVHPKFRKHSTPEYLTQADSVRTQKLQRQSSLSSSHTSPPVSPPTMYKAQPNTSLEEAPLDFSIRKRNASPTPPPPYKYSNPLRQHSPPISRSSQSPPLHTSHLPVNPAPAYISFPHHKPPPYPRTPSPSDARPPPPSYEAAIASKPISPASISRLQPPTTSPTYITLHPRPSPSTTQGSEYTVSSPPPCQSKSDSVARPSVICSAPSVRKESEKLAILPSQENKENKDITDPQRNRKREVTIVEESGAVDLMEEHFRKSLGEDYSKVFKESEKKKESVESSTESTSEMEVDPVKAFKEDLDMSGYTVEDHFAKALGETWIKLQAEAEKKEKKSSSTPKESKPQLLAL